MAFPDTDLPLIVEANFGGQWQNLSSRLQGDPVTITRGKAAGARQVGAGSCTLILDDDDGALTPLNPVGGFFPSVRRGAEFRVRFPEAVVDGANGAATASHVAPSVDVLDGPALLACMWMGFNNSSGTNFNYSLPGGMTGGPEADDGDYGTSVVATQSVSAGATGTRTATSSPSADFWMALSVSVPGTITVQERLSDAAFNANVVLTTSSGTQAGWWLLAMNCWDVTPQSSPPPAPSGDGWVLLGEHYGNGWIRAWLKRVETAGAQAVTFAEAGPILPDNHAHLLVLSGVEDLVLPQAAARRFHGTAASYRPRLIPTTEGTIRAVQQVTLGGPLRRFGQGSSKLKSALYREATGTANSAFMVGYWPCEDDSGATQAASGIGGSPMTPTIAPPDFASSSIFTGSAPLPTLVNGALIGNVPFRASTGVLSFRGCFFIPAAGIADGSLLADIRQTGGGSVGTWRLTYHTGGGLSVKAIGLDGSTVADGGAIGFDVRGKKLMIGFSAEQDGGSVDWHIFTREVSEEGDIIELGFDNTFASLTVGSARQLVIAANGAMTGCVVGHLMLGNSASLAALIDTALVGHAGETAAARIGRLGDEEGVPVTIYGVAADSAPVGPQRVASLPDLFDDAANADGGLLGESRMENGLTYLTRTAMYNQTATLAVDLATYSTTKGTSASVLTPVYDDQGLRNDVEVTRTGGSSARVTDPASIAADGVYDEAFEVNVAYDGQLPDIAGWAVHEGTADEYRNPAFALDLGANPDLIAAWCGTDIGSRVQRLNPPAPHPPDTIDQLLEGYTETYTPKSWTASGNASPAGPWDVGLWDSTAARYDTAGSELAQDLDAGTDTAALVLTTSGPLWTTDGTKVSVSAPMDLRCSGARLRATGIANGLTDSFGRTASNGWGMPDSTFMGTGYTVVGTASEYSVVGPGTGRMQLVSVNDLHIAHVDAGSSDCRVYGGGILGVVPTGSGISLGVLGRFTDTNNYYNLTLLISTAGVVTLQIFRRVAGVGASVSSAVTLPLTHSAGNEWRMVLDILGSDLHAKAWRFNETEPTHWLVSGTDTGLTSGTRIGALARRETGNTNGSTAADWADFNLLNPQTVTISSTVVNSVNKTIVAAEPLRLWKPAVYAR